MYQYFNPNPCNKSVGDCTIRAICKVLDKPWDEIYMALCMQGLLMCDMPSSNKVWGAYLKSQGFSRSLIPDDGIENYSVVRFCHDHQEGTYLLALESHVVAVVDGVYYDTWDSGEEPPIYYWEKGKDE